MKKIALICVISLLSALLLPFSSYAAVKTKINSEFLYELGICARDVSKTERITRGEFAEYIAYIYYGGKSEFNREDAIKLMIEKGFIDMASSGNFEPNLPIRNDVAAKAAVELLGHGFKVKTADDYWYVATQLKLVNAMRPTTFLSGGELVKLLTGILDADALVAESPGNTLTSFKVVKGCEAFFDIQKVKGQVTAAGGRSLSDKKPAGDGMARIDGKLFETDFPMEDLLGLKVAAYVRMSDDMIIYAEDISTEKVYITDDILDRNRTTLREIVTEDENGKVKEYSIATNAEVIINNDGYFGYSLSDLLIEYGSITLVDNNHDRVYDVVRIESYRVLAVNYTENTNMSIGDFYGNDINDLAELDGVTVTRDGREAFFSEIMQDDVVGVAIDMGGNYAKIVATSDSITGRVEGIEDDEITVDGTLYKLAPKYISAPVSNKIAIAMGDTITATLDMYGRIAYVKKAQSGNLRYGYLTNIFLDDGQGTAEMKIFTENDEFATYSVSRRAKLNSGTEMSNSNIRNEFFTTPATPNKATPQLIKYRINKDNEIMAVYTADDTDKFKEDYKFTDDPTDTDASKRRWRTEMSGGRVVVGRKISGLGGGPNDGDFLYNSQTVVFRVPKADRYDKEEEYYIADKLLNSSSEYAKIKISAFDVDEFGYVKAILCQPYEDVSTAPPADTKDGAIFVLSKIVETINADNEPIIKLIGLDRSSEQEYVVEQSNFDLVRNTDGSYKYQKGDAVFVVTDFVTDYAVNVVMLGNKATSSAVLGTGNGDSKGVWYYEAVRGKVENRLGSTLKVKVGTIYNVFQATGASFFVVEDGAVRYGSAGDVRIGDEIILRARAGVVKEVIIYR